MCGTCAAHDLVDKHVQVHHSSLCRQIGLGALEQQRLLWTRHSWDSQTPVGHICPGEAQAAVGQTSPWTVVAAENTHRQVQQPGTALNAVEQICPQAA